MIYLVGQRNVCGCLRFFFSLKCIFFCSFPDFHILSPQLFIHVEGKNEILQTNDKGIVFAQGVFYEAKTGKIVPVRDSGIVFSSIVIVPLESLSSYFQVDQIQFS